MFDRVIVLLAVNADKRPTAEATARAAGVRNAMPAAWGNVDRLVAVPSAAGRRFVHGRTRIPLGTVDPSVPEL
jgi:hypothetical protein